jgi:hypothetical protein
MRVKKIVQSVGLVCALAYTTGAHAFLSDIKSKMTGAACSGAVASQVDKKTKGPTKAAKQCALRMGNKETALQNPNFIHNFLDTHCDTAKKKKQKTCAMVLKGEKYLDAEEADSEGDDSDEESLDEE